MDKLAAGNRVEGSRTTEGKTAVVQGFDLPKKSSYLKQYSFGSSTNPITVPVEAPSVKEMSQEEVTNNLKQMASSITFQAGFNVISDKQFNRFGGHFFVAKVGQDGEPGDPNFNAAFDVPIALDPSKDLPTAEFVTPIRYSNSFLTSMSAKASIQAKIPAIATISLSATTDSFCQLTVSAKWFNFRISKTIAEALSQRKQENCAAILAQLASSSDNRLFYVYGFTGVPSFEYSYKSTTSATSANSIDFVYGGAALTFQQSREQTGTASLDDTIVALWRQSLGYATGVTALFKAVPPASLPAPPPIDKAIVQKVDKLLRIDAKGSR